MKRCPICRGPLNNLNRYSLIVRRALIDEATKKFIVWANNNFIPLVTRMQIFEAALRETKDGAQKLPSSSQPETQELKQLQLTGSRDHQINEISNRDNRYKRIVSLRRDIKKFLRQVGQEEQPFGRIYDLAKDARRHGGVATDFPVQVDILQVRNHLLATVLLIRCDYTIISNFLNDQEGRSAITIKIDFGANSKDCEVLINNSQARSQIACTIEGHLYWARFLALERHLAPDPSSEALVQLLQQARTHVQLAHEICSAHPGQAVGMASEISEAEKMLRDSTFYVPVTNEEKAAVYAAMARDFRGTGHWYYCVNGHPFTVDRCGMPMQTSVCPQCGSPIGGTNHMSVEGVQRADDLDDMFGGLRL